ncbi:FeoA family protein [Thermosulfidibacter takaii]|nr:FeoA family protein [Thermosulfidibacter takaii]
MTAKASIRGASGNLFKLSEVSAQKRYRVVSFEKTSAQMLRLREMGLKPGAVIIVLRKAPLGDPVEIQIKGHPITLRKSEAENIWVEEVDHE